MVVTTLLWEIPQYVASDGVEGDHTHSSAGLTQLRIFTAAQGIGGGIVRTRTVRCGRASEKADRSFGVIKVGWLITRHSERG